MDLTIVPGDKVMLKPGHTLIDGEIKPYAIYTIKSIYKSPNFPPYVQLEETPVSYGLEFFEKVESKAHLPMGCQHEMKTYHGFTESYMYCTKCDYTDKNS